jgi:hypothetical protein
LGQGVGHLDEALEAVVAVCGAWVEEEEVGRRRINTKTIAAAWQENQKY